MSDELIRKSDVIATLNNWLEGEETETLFGMFGIGYNGAVRDIIKLIKTEKPVNAVELPCEVGDTVYVINNNAIKEYLVGGFNVGMRSKSDSSLMVVLECTYPNIHLLADMIGSLVFLTQEEAEKALEDLKNDK